MTEWRDAITDPPECGFDHDFYKESAPVLVATTANGGRALRIAYRIIAHGVTYWRHADRGIGRNPTHWMSMPPLPEDDQP